MAHSESVLSGMHFVAVSDTCLVWHDPANMYFFHLITEHEVNLALVNAP